MVRILGAGESEQEYKARGSRMFFKAMAGQDDGDTEARLLVIHAPAMDAYFAELHHLWNREQPPTPDEERELMARFGMEKA